MVLPIDVTLWQIPIGFSGKSVDGHSQTVQVCGSFLLLLQNFLFPQLTDPLLPCQGSCVCVHLAAGRLPFLSCWHACIVLIWAHCWWILIKIITTPRRRGHKPAWSVRHLDLNCVNIAKLFQAQISRIRLTGQQNWVEGKRWTWSGPWSQVLVVGCK